MCKIIKKFEEIPSTNANTFILGCLLLVMLSVCFEIVLTKIQ
jgi:hypothetical protein